MMSDDDLAKQARREKIRAYQARNRRNKASKQYRQDRAEAQQREAAAASRYRGIDLGDRCRAPHPTEPGRLCLLPPGHTDPHGDDFGPHGWWPHGDMPTTRAILTNLIADLREVFDMHPLSPSLAASVRACLDAAETQLQGVHDE